MKVNVDTYVLPEESDRFLAEVLPSSNPLRQAWEVLSCEEKEGYLLSAMRRLEAVNYKGDRVWFYQPLKFPRIARNIPPDFQNAPVEIQRAQVVWATDVLREELFVKRRNNEACIALGLVKAGTEAETPSESKMPKLVYELLHRWLTSWRRV